MSKRYKNSGGKAYHREIVAKTLGRPLTSEECVHHIDEDVNNNDPSNLVLCPNNLYHKLLHIRQEAFNVTGDFNKRKCRICGQYDSVDNMKEYRRHPSTYFVHRLCNNKKHLDWYYGR